MLKQIPYLLIFTALQCACLASSIRITGVGQYELVNPFDSSTKAIASSRLVIVVDGAQYRISSESTMGAETMEVGAETMKGEYGCDGFDTFVITDRPNAVNTGTGPSGIIYAGRFPTFCSILVQTAWLGYCSRNYFENSSNHTDLKLSELLSWTPPENVTNLVTYWPDSTLPQKITGWSRNLVTIGNEQPVELKQYPSGFKAWKFTASDEVLISGIRLPRRITLEGFVPKPPKDATSGEETTLVRKISFVADTVTVESNSIDPLPPITVANLPINDKRFLKEMWPQILTAHATPASGWPTRQSSAFKALEQQALDAGYEKTLEQPNPKRAKVAILIICGINLILFVLFIRAIRKNKLNTNKTNN